MPSRIYVVADSHEAADAVPRLIKATYEDMAVRHASRGRYTVHIASKDELEHWLPQVKVEYAEGVAQRQLPLGAK